jgi:hypothetical protein
MVVDPMNPAHIYAAGYVQGTDGLTETVWRTWDAGEHWSSIASPGYHGLAFDAASTNIVYGLRTGLYKSTDGGLTWNPTQLRRVHSVTADPTVPGVVYAVAPADSAFLISELLTYPHRNLSGSITGDSRRLRHPLSLIPRLNAWKPTTAGFRPQSALLPVQKADRFRSAPSARAATEIFCP